ncbi:unnamed protein product [Colias eurytheme]|nr:unnamed protein product [Colias eurytheme]
MHFVNMSVLRSIAVFLCALFTLTTVNAQVVLPGGCPDVAAMTDFIPSRYLGKWYEVEKYFAIFELGGKCITATYSEKDNGAIAVHNQQVNTYSGVKSGILGVAVQVSRSDEAKLSVRFPSLPVDIPAPYWVLETDYDNYSLVWSCMDLGFMHTEIAWILTRQRHPPLSVLEQVYAAADKNNISRAYFMKTDQTNCPDDDEE